MITQWYYADRNQQQQGPVEAAWMQAAFARGEINAASLVWRDGLAAWQPLSLVAPELGIALQHAAPPTVPRKPAIVTPRKGGMPAIVIVLIVLAAMVPILGILAAISIPAYQDYTNRAKVMQAVQSGTALKLNVEEFVLSNEQCPANGEAGILPPEAYAQPPLRAINVGTLDDGTGRCAIELQLDDMDFDGELDNVTLIRRGSGDWGSDSTLPPKYLPSSLRYQQE